MTGRQTGRQTNTQTDKHGQKTDKRRDTDRQTNRNIDRQADRQLTSEPCHRLHNKLKFSATRRWVTKELTEVPCLMVTVRFPCKMLLLVFLSVFLYSCEKLMFSKKHIRTDTEHIQRTSLYYRWSS